jgi:hypothetical protein
VRRRHRGQRRGRGIVIAPARSVLGQGRGAAGAPVDLILDTPALSDADRIAILGGTAAKLLRLAS